MGTYGGRGNDVNMYNMYGSGAFELTNFSINVDEYKAFNIIKDSNVGSSTRVGQWYNLTYNNESIFSYKGDGSTFDGITWRVDKSVASINHVYFSVSPTPARRLYNYRIRFTSTKAGSMEFQKSGERRDVVVGENVWTGTMLLEQTAMPRNRIGFNLMRMPIGSEIHFEEYEFTPIEKQAWYYQKNATVLSERKEGFTYTTTSLGLREDSAAAYNNISVYEDTVYNCSFTLTAEHEKAFVPLLSSGSFTEIGSKEWTQNVGENTYSYNYKGRVRIPSETSVEDFVLRLGYYSSDYSTCGLEHGDTIYKRGDRATFTVSDFTFEEYVPTAPESDLAVQCLQIRTIEQETSVAYRTVCKAPNVGRSITASDGNTYTVKSTGTIYTMDYYGTTGYRKDNRLSTTYTTLNTVNTQQNAQYKYIGNKIYDNLNWTRGYISTNQAVLSNFNPEDSTHTYYATTMQGMDDFMANTLYVRAFVETDEGPVIYSEKTAVTSVAEIADYLYRKNKTNNATAHNYLYSAILNDNRLNLAGNRNMAGVIICIRNKE